MSLYSQLISQSSTSQQSCETLLTHLQNKAITGTAEGESQLTSSIISQIVNNGINGDYDDTLKQCVINSLSNIIGGTQFEGRYQYADVIEYFSFSLLFDQPCPSAPFRMTSDKLDIIAIQGFSSDLSEYIFSLNGNSFDLPSNLIAPSIGETCGAKAYMANMDVPSRGIFMDPQVESLFGQTVLSVGAQSSTGETVSVYILYSYSITDYDYIHAPTL